MVKKWIFMILLSFILVIGCVCESIFVNRSFDWLINSLESVQIELKENKDSIDSEKFINDIYKLHSDWSDKVKTLKCLIWHSNIKDIEIGLARISVYVEENNFTEAYAEIAALIDFSAHYLDDFRVSVENIF
jgi:hypothetical protein